MKVDRRDGASDFARRTENRMMIFWVVGRYLSRSNVDSPC